MTKTSNGVLMKVLKALKPWGEALLQALAMTLVLFFILWPVQVDGPSMEHTLMNGDRLVMSRVLAMLGQVSKGDIVICKSNHSDDNIVKRVIAAPGDSISIANNLVTVNGEILDEYDYLDEWVVTDGDISLTLNDDEYFIMGDNRGNSLDSRQTGVVKKREIVGKVVFRFFPFNEIRLF